MNNFITNNLKKKVRPLKLTIIGKIIAVIEAYHKDPSGFDKSLYNRAKCTFFINKKLKF